MPQSNKVELKVVQKSAFPGKSHFNQGTAKVGTLVPILVDELIPNTTVDIKMAIAASLPPLATDTFMNLDYCVEAFFVPMRLCFAGFEAFFTGNNDRYYYEEGPVDSVKSVWPRMGISCVGETSYGSLPNQDLRFLSFPHLLPDYFSAFYKHEDANGMIYINMPLYVAYHLIWDTWYRNTLVQKSAFMKFNAFQDTSLSPSTMPFALLPSLSFSQAYGTILAATGAITDSQEALGDGMYLPYSSDLFGDDYWFIRQLCFADAWPFWLPRQRNFGFDYFTNAWPTAQFGEAQTVQADASGKISIAAIRGASSLQQFEERGQFCPRLVEAVRARYGANLSDAIAQRPILLGTGRYPIVSKTIDVTAQDADSTQNPFANNAGGQVARGFANGTEHIIDNFTAQEPGYLFILGSLVPSVTYSSGIDRINTRYIINPTGARAEMADPQLQNTGNQPIYREELTGSMMAQNAGHSPIFGFTDRFADFMVKRSTVHGLLRDTIDSAGFAGSLSAFVLQRGFEDPQNSTVSINSNFLQIPTNYLDNVTLVKEAVSDYGYWYECGFNYRCSMPLAQYSIPSLQDPAYEHGHSITVHRGGFRF